MKIDINLSSKNRKTLRNLCRRLFSDFKKIKVSKGTVTFRRRWYSLPKIRVQVVDLVLLQIPQKINELYEEYNMDSVFNFADTIDDSVEYFAEECEGRDIIQYLQYQIDDLDMSMALEESFSREPALLKQKEEACLEESYATRKTFIDTVDFFSEQITKVITEIQQSLRVVYITTESACNSPPIRAPGLAA